LNAHVSPSGWPALVLNADFRPLSYYPLSLWCWQDTIKAVFLDRVNIVAHYDKAVRSPSFEMQLPSVVSLKTFVKPSTNPAFTRFNVFLRDRFACQYCGSGDDLTFDHLIPRSRGGQTTWINVVAACSPCNLRKGNLTPHEASMHPPSCRSSRPCTICTATDGCSHPITSTTAGSTISTGTANSSRRAGRAIAAAWWSFLAGHPSVPTRLAPRADYGLHCRPELIR
jgi:5-methylcytosine-specific restriction endonuclease McrA